jgi:hypothetical protein
MPVRHLPRARAPLAFAALLSAACVPAETRPEPGQLSIAVRGDAALARGIAAEETADGWAVSWERFLVSLGGAELDDGEGACQPYFGGSYTRVLAMEGEGTDSTAQKLSIVFGLGECDFGFGARNPRWDALLGAGVTEAEKEAMRTPGSDAYETDRGITAWVRGTARRGGVEKRFDWAFRRGLEYSGCRVDTEDGTERGVSLQAGDQRSLELRVRGAALFADASDETIASLRFDPFARADDEHGDADGEVTLDELGRVPIGEMVAAGTEVDPAWTTLRDWLYLGRFPALPRYRDTGWCAMAIEEDDDD